MRTSRRLRSAGEAAQKRSEGYDGREERRQKGWLPQKEGTACEQRRLWARETVIVQVGTLCTREMTR